MAHDCPECGLMCYCHGDIDDSVVETREFSDAHCTHCPADGERENSPVSDDDAEYFNGLYAQLERSPTPKEQNKEGE